MTAWIRDPTQVPLGPDTDTPRLSTREIVKRHLAALELLEAPENIARFLQRLGFIGERREHDHCPLTSYLRCAAQTNLISVCAADTMYMGGQIELDCIPNPRAVAQFVSHFDQGRYPWLEHPTELTA